MIFRDLRSEPVSRRGFLKRSALTAASLPLPFAPRQSRASSLKPVSLTLDWVYQGPNAGFMVAREQGFYRDAGLDVSINAGKGSAITAQLVAAKACQVGFVDGYIIGRGDAKGMDIKAIGSIFRRNPCAIMVFEDSPIKSAKHLEGKTVAISAGSSVTQQFPAFCKGSGIDASKVHIVNVDPTGLAPALISGKVDAIGAYVSSYVPMLEIRGKKPVRTLSFSDAGVIAVSNSITMHNDLIKSDPSLVHSFLSATLKGFLYGRQHPDQAVAAVKSYQPTVDPAITRRELEVSWKLWLTPNTMGKPLGFSSRADWQSTIRVLHQYAGVSAPLEPAELFTNEFVPAGAAYIPPQGA